MRKILIGAVLGALLPDDLAHSGRQAAAAACCRCIRDGAAKEPLPDESLVLAAAVTVARVAPADFVETVLATGSLVAREEILVGPEVEGLRITEVLADEGMRVKKGDVLAQLVADTLDAQLAQNDAALARATAAIAQARSAIVQAEARLVESSNAFERAKPLRAAGHMAESAFDQREQAARTAQAQLVAARDGLTAAEAEKAQIEAQRRELDLAARPHRGGGAGRRHRQPPHGAHRRLCGRRRRAHVPHRRQGRGRARRRGHRDAHGRPQDRTARARRDHGSGRDRRHRPPRVARGRQGARVSAACASSSATTLA